MKKSFEVTTLFFENPNPFIRDHFQKKHHLSIPIDTTHHASLPLPSSISRLPLVPNHSSYLAVVVGVGEENVPITLHLLVSGGAHAALGVLAHEE